VLSGKLGFQLDELIVEVGSGGGILVPRGTGHTFWKPGPVPARYLIVIPPRTGRAAAGALNAALHSRRRRFVGHWRRGSRRGRGRQARRSRPLVLLPWRAKGDVSRSLHVAARSSRSGGNTARAFDVESGDAQCFSEFVSA
jgi:hypothetical protein